MVKLNVCVTCPKKWRAICVKWAKPRHKLSDAFLGPVHAFVRRAAADKTQQTCVLYQYSKLNARTLKQMFLRDSLIGTRNETKDVDFSTFLDAWILDLRLTFELQKYFFEGLQSLSLLRF